MTHGVRVMAKLTPEDKADIREGLDRDNKRINYERTYGDMTATRAKRYTCAKLASLYGVTYGQMVYFLGGLA